MLIKVSLTIKSIDKHHEVVLHTLLKTKKQQSYVHDCCRFHSTRIIPHLLLPGRFFSNKSSIIPSFVAAMYALCEAWENSVRDVIS